MKPSFKIFISVFVILYLNACNLQTQQTLQTDPSCKEVFDVVEEMPELIGGISGLKERLRYHTEGRVIVQFVVNKNGTPVNLEIIESLWFEADQEALRLVSTSKFDPGRMNRKQTCVKMQLSINFSAN